MCNTVDEFADWYEKNNFPIRPPQDDPIYITDISYSYVLYREGQYQVELYIIDSNSITPEHSHPGVESIIMFLAGECNTTINGNLLYDASPYFNLINNDGTSVMFKYRARLNPKDTHGLKVYDAGTAFLSIEKWPDEMVPSSVALHWEGETVGNTHNKILENL